MRDLLKIVFPFCAFLVMLSTSAKAQNLNIDSLLQVLDQANDDTSKVMLYIQVAEQYDFSKPDSAIYYYREARDLSQRLNYKRGLIRYMLSRQYLMNIQGQYDSALILCQAAMELSDKIGDRALLASAIGNTGSVYLYTGDKKKAIDYYLRCAILLEQLKDTKKLTNLYSNLCVLYQRLNQFDNSILYGEKAISLARKSGYASELGSVLSNMGATFIGMNDPSGAWPYLKEALMISRELNDPQLRLTALINMSTVMAMPTAKSHQIYNKAYLDEALQLSTKLDHKTGLAISLRCLADYYFHERQFDKAKAYALQSLAITREFKNPEDEKKVLSLLSHISAATFDLRSYERYYWQRDSVAASLVNQELANSIKELEVKYETEKKEDQILGLQREQHLQEVAIRQKNIINAVLGGMIIILLIAAALLYRNYKQRQLLQQQTIRELETERTLSATDAVLQGQEVERSRLAKDLHDGLGGILSGAKFTFDAMKDNMIMTTENQKAFARGMDLLETSIKELRRVAHNMMPESLAKTGLAQAVKELCEDLQQDMVRIIYQEYGIENADFSQTVSITVYRVIQELLNNAMKHAQASEIIVQLSFHDNRLQLTVEDNGKGFTKGQIASSKGMGWSNIQSRVDYLKGTVDVQSVADKGTSVTITLPI